MRGGLIILKSNKSKITILLILFVIGIAGTIYSFNSNQEPVEKIFLTSEETKWLNENKDEITG